MQTVVEHAMVDGLVAITEVEARVEHKQLKSCNLAQVTAIKNIQPSYKYVLVCTPTNKDVHDVLVFTCGVEDVRKCINCQLLYVLSKIYCALR